MTSWLDDCGQRKPVFAMDNSTPTDQLVLVAATAKRHQATLNEMRKYWLTDFRCGTTAAQVVLETHLNVTGPAWPGLLAVMLVAMATFSSTIVALNVALYDLVIASRL